MTPEFRTTIIALMRENGVKELKVKLGDDDSISFYTEAAIGYWPGLATDFPSIADALNQAGPDGMVITHFGTNDCKFPS